MELQDSNVCTLRCHQTWQAGRSVVMMEVYNWEHHRTI